MNIPFLSFSGMHGQIRDEMHQAFSEVYDSNWLVLGRQVETFERSYARFNKVENCVGVSNGLDALYLSLKVLGVTKGDEVIVPSNTYIASALAVSYTGADPVFVEPRQDTCNLDPTRLEAAITSRTKAIMPVHLYGQACEMEAIMDVAQRHGLFVVEDNAQSHGATFNGRLTGSWGQINGTSFYPGKNLGALGDAGAVTTDDKALAEQVNTLRNYGSKKKYYNEVIGHNMRLDELQAAFLLVKLKYLAHWTAERRKVAAMYDERLKGVGDLRLPLVAPGASHVYHIYMVRTNNRDELRNHLEENGVGTLIHYPLPPHLQEAYSFLGHKQGDFPIAEEIAGTCLSIPLWPGMTEQQVDRVASVVKGYFHQKQGLI